MSLESQEAFQKQYQAGKQAFERGQYRTSIERLKAACELTITSSRLGGETQLWLVTAYQAAGESADAIALCESLLQHPHSATRQQAKRLLEIIKAPILKRPKEWMTEIPDLKNLSDSSREDRFIRSKPTQEPKKKYQPEPVDLTQVDTKDNHFTGIALVAILLILGGLWLFSARPWG
ncbi:tetratricopeptide repeat protein [Lusitaniella coriacea]|uniref:tetratricopeptide repeat protein n=1 Tax=Lusitaniella coriacea TaxID=1983105 RepID=UPI003CF94AD6